MTVPTAIPILRLSSDYPCLVDVPRTLYATGTEIPGQVSVTNAVSEGLNSRIQWVKATAGGFRNQQNFITAIYFHCGGLDLDPETATH